MKYERLTIKDKDGHWQVWEDDYSHPFEALQTAIDKLAELEDKIENGTLIEIPCMHKTVFGYYRVTFFSKMFNCIDSELFFNKAEAEKKLKELQGE